MHELYVLAVLSNASRHRTTERTPEQRLRDEQTFYELHSGDRSPRFKRFSRLAAAVPVVALALAVAVGLAHLPGH